MVYTLKDHRKDVIKCSKLKWNHEPQASGFIAKFWTFYAVISMVYKSVDHWKLWSICFFYNNIYFYLPAMFLGKCYVISMVYILIDHSSWPISALGPDSLSYRKKRHRPSLRETISLHESRKDSAFPFLTYLKSAGRVVSRQFSKRRNWIDNLDFFTPPTVMTRLRSVAENIERLFPQKILKQVL